MKAFKIILAGAFAAIALAACNNSDEPAPEQEYDEAYWAENATISSSSTDFTSNDGGGSVEFNAGGGSVVINVSCGTDWTADNTGSDWLTATAASSAGTLTLTAGENSGQDKLSATVTLKTAASGIKFATVTVTQNPTVYLNLGVESVSFGPEGGTVLITVETNYGWSAHCETIGDWLLIDASSTGLTVTVDENDTTEDRETVIEFSAGSGDNVIQTTVPVTQTCRKDLVLVYTTTSANYSLMLPLSGTVDCTIDWGDGSEAETVTKTFPTHTYETAGTYSVSITGTVTALNNYSASSRAYLTEVARWGDTGLNNMNQAFYNCSKLTTLPEGAGPFTDVTTFNWAFYNTAITSVPADLFAKCENAEVFSYLFYNCKSLKEIPAGLFDGCTAATTFEGAFYNCTSITATPDGLFANCPEVTSFEKLFQGCTALSSVSAGIFDNCTKNTSFGYLFCNCSALTSLPEGIFDNCPEVTSFYWTFYGCFYLVMDPSKLLTNCLKVTTFNCAFYSCLSLTGESPYNEITVDGETVKVHLYERSTYADQLGCTVPENGNGCFRSCSGLSDYSSIPSGWK